MRLQGYLNEKYFKGFSIRERYVEVFKNPSVKEYKEASVNDRARAFLLNRDMYIWNPYGGIHFEVQEKLKLGKNALPIIIFGSIRGNISIVVTDYSKKTIWHHNPKIKEYILKKSYLSKFNVTDISYFDEMIFGPWDEMG